MKQFLTITLMLMMAISTVGVYAEDFPTFAESKKTDSEKEVDYDRKRLSEKDAECGDTGLAARALFGNCPKRRYLYDHTKACDWWDNDPLTSLYDFDYCKETASQGDVWNQYFLGDIYYRGIKEPQNFALAYKWYKEASYRGLGVAQLRLAYLYALGHGVKENKEEAYIWASLAILFNQKEKGVVARDEWAKSFTSDEINLLQERVSVRYDEVKKFSDEQNRIYQNFREEERKEFLKDDYRIIE